MKSALFFASAYAVILSSAYGQVYLIQGSPTPKYGGGYATSLLRVGADASVGAVSEILPGGRSGGAEWIGVSNDLRKVVFLAKRPSRTIVVVDFDAASVVKKCDPPPAPTGMSSFPFEEWLANIPGKGLVYVERYGTADTKKLESGQSAVGDDTTRGMLVDAEAPCEQSFMAVPPGDIKFLVSDGQTGVADLGSWTTKNVGVGLDGTAAVGWFGGARTYFDYRVPDDMIRGFSRPTAWIALSGGQLLGLLITDASNGLVRVPILRKNDNTWRALPGLGATAPFVRAFGSYIALAETEPKTALNSESAGRAEWRKAEAATGPSIAERLGNLPYVLPGRLDLYDANTEKMYHIDTKQGDSEILLVDNNTVYYRVSDRLYSAAIGSSGLEPAKLLAQSESIRGVHWAFVKR